MALNRRRFILLGGLLLGASSTGALRNPRGQTAALPPLSGPRDLTQAADGVAASTTAGDAIGPAGFFAPQRGDIRLAVISDLNNAYGSTDYLPEVSEGVKLLPGWQPDLVICGGDMIAGQSLDLSAAQIDAMWAAFDAQILDPIRDAGLPFALTIGNHDGSGYRNGGEFVYVLDRQESAKYWQGHQSETALSFVEANSFPFHYSFKQNDIFFLVWDASSATIPPEQVAWADRALASPQAQSARLRIVLGHLPLYAVSQRRDRPGEYLNQADALRQLMERHGVHTYISGHHHAYFPGRVGNLNTLHAGALGSGPKALLATTAEPIQTLTIMDLFLDTSRTVYTTYNMTDHTVVDLQSLPRQVVGPNGRVLRQDLLARDLTPAERSQAYILSGS